MPVTDDGEFRTYYPKHRFNHRYQDPKDEPGTVFVEQEHISHGPGFVKEHRVVKLDRSRERRDLSQTEHRRSSTSDNQQRRKAVLSEQAHRRRYSSQSEPDSDSDTDGSSPRRVRSPKHYDTYPPITRPAPVYTNPPNRSRSVGAPRSRSQSPPGPIRRRYDSDNDYSSSDDDGGKKAPPKPRPKQFLYTGLACIATIAAGNNIYQSAKAHHTRQRELEEGEISGAEAQKLKAQARKMDLISLGVAAVGAYNVRNGWRRAEAHWKAHREKQAEGRR